MASSTPSVPHDDKGFSEEKCLRCGWVMGQPPLNCQNDDTPHVFPSQGGVMAEETSFVTWARSELERAGLFDQDSDYEGMLGTEVMRMVETFSAAGHSGFSAALAASIFARLSAWKPLTPITDAPAEWMHIDEDDMTGQPNLWQSRRQSSLFSHDGGKTYYDLDERLPRWRRLAERVLHRRLPVYHEAQPA